MASLSALYSKANIAPDRQVTTPTTATSTNGGNRISRFLEKNPLKEKEKFVGIVTDAGFVPDEDTIERIKRNPELKKKLPNMTPTGDGGFTCDAGYFENVTITHCPTLSEQARASPIGLATTGKVVQKNDYEYAQHMNAKHFNRMDYRRVIVHDSGVLFVYHLLKNHLPGSYPSPVVCGSRTSNPYVCMMKKMFPDGGGGSGGNHDVAWVTKMNNRALQKVPEGCAQSGILMDLQLLNPGDHKDMKAEQLLDWAGEIPSALYHKAGKLIARSQVLDRSFRTKIFDGNASETHCVGAGESTGEMKTNTIFRPSVPDDDDQGASLLDDQDTSDKMLREAMVLLEKLKKRNVVRKWKNNKLQQRFSTWGHCAMGYLQMHPPFSNPELAIQEWEIAAKGGCQIARYNIAMAILRGDYGVHDIDRTVLNNVRARLKDHPDVIIRKKEGAPWDKVKSDHPNEKYTSEYAVQLLIENAEKHDDMVSYSMLIHKIYNPNMEVDIYNLERFNAKNVPDNPLQVWIRKKSAKQEALRHAVCRSCGIMRKTITKCGRCGCTFYCSSKCQRMDWDAGHKKICKQLKKGYTDLTHRY